MGFRFNIWLGHSIFARLIMSMEWYVIHAYSGYGLSAIGTFLSMSKGDVQIAEYTKDVLGGENKRAAG